MAGAGPMRGPQFEKFDQCQAALESGIPNDQLPGTFPVTMKSSLNCKFKVDGKIAYIALPEDDAKTIAFIKELPIIPSIEVFVADESEFENPADIVPDGVYLWLLYKDPGQEHFSWAFRKVRSILEVGTLHKSIARAVGAGTIHAAGEIEKKNGKLIINYLSGSYMLNACDRDARTRVMDQLFGENTGAMPYSFTDKTLITEEPTMEELRYYASKGFRICLHEPDKFRECMATKGTCKDILKPQEGAMRGGDDENQQPTKKEVKTPKTPPRAFGVSQAQEARRQLALRNAGVPEPVPQIEGMGRKRKTRRGKKSKRRMTKKKW